MLAGFGGTGLLVLKRGDAGLTGYWQLTGPACPQVYTTLHALYQSQDALAYCGCVVEEARGYAARRQMQVIISSWARHDRPGRLELRACAAQLTTPVERGARATES